MLEFFGLYIKKEDRKTGKVTRLKNFRERYNCTVLVYAGYHIMIRTILIFLNISGFRKYAISLVKFFEIEIYGKEGIYQEHYERPMKFKKLPKKVSPL